MVNLLLVIILFSVVMNAGAGTMNSVSVDEYQLTYYANDNDQIQFCVASHACVTMGGNLVKIDTKSIEKGIINMMSVWEGNRETWVGGTDMYAEENWKWLDNTLFIDGYTNWSPGEPNDYRDEDCLNFHSPKNVWYDHSCDKHHGFICQKKIDLVISADHIVLFLSSVAESFREANESCTNMGMRLVEIKSARAFEVVQKNIKNMKDTANYWVAGNTLNNNNIRKWNDGDAFDYPKWAAGNPSKNGVNRCLIMNHDGWTDGDCEKSKNRFVCEAILPHALRVSSQSAVTSQDQSVTVDCSADGFPQPEVNWYKDGKIISDNTEHRVYQSVEESSSTLTISKAQLTDAGEYRCFAINYINGTKRMTEGFLELEVLPFGKPIPQNTKARNIEQEPERTDGGGLDEMENNLDLENEICSDSNWVLPVLITLIALLLLQFIVIIYQR